MVAAHREHARLRLHTEREPARDPSRVRRGAVCAEAGHSPEGRPSRAGLKMLSAFCLSVQTGGILSGDDGRLRSTSHFIDTNTGALTSRVT